ncbi:MAG: hypothetical protein NVSMB27_11130 [Ktedonobacteraceae bacterium]
MSAHPLHKHLGQRVGDFRFVATVAFKHLTVKLPFPISRNLEIFNVSGRSYEVASVGPIAIASTSGCAFSPRCTKTLFEFFTHNLFEQNLNRTHGKTTQLLTKGFLLWQS